MIDNEAIRSVIDSDTGMEARRRARSRAERRAEEARSQLGRVALDMAEEYFPEETKSRRRRSVQRAFLLGVAVGIFIAALVGGRE